MTSIRARLPETIATDRLVLTTPTMAHAPDIARLANNRRIYDVMARLPFPYGDEDARFFIEEIVPSAAERCYAILLDGRVFMGIVGLSFADGHAPELGYWLGEPYWGKGYATEAAMAVVAAGRAAGATGLRSRALLDNAGSRNVLAKAGFTEIGEEIEASNNLKGRTIMRMRLDFAP